MSFDLDNPYKLGWTLGKFMPFHQGHAWLADNMITKNDAVLFIVCQHPSEPMPVEVRKNMIIEFLKSFKEVYPDKPMMVMTYYGDAPQSPDNLDELQSKIFWTIWKDICNLRLEIAREKLPSNLFQLHLYTGDDYSDKLSLITHSEWHIVDRKTFDVSATMIRNNFVENWNLIPKQSQPALMEWLNQIVWNNWKKTDPQSFEIIEI